MVTKRDHKTTLQSKGYYLADAACVAIFTLDNVSTSLYCSLVLLTRKAVLELLQVALAELQAALVDVQAAVVVQPIGRVSFGSAIRWCLSYSTHAKGVWNGNVCVMYCVCWAGPAQNRVRWRRCCNNLSAYDTAHHGEPCHLGVFFVQILAESKDN